MDVHTWTPMDCACVDIARFMLAGCVDFICHRSFYFKFLTPSTMYVPLTMLKYWQFVTVFKMMLWQDLGYLHARFHILNLCRVLVLTFTMIIHILWFCLTMMSVSVLNEIIFSVQNNQQIAYNLYAKLGIDAIVCNKSKNQNAT